MAERTFNSPEEFQQYLESLPVAEAKSILAKAKVKATGVVRRADGSIKYDDPTKAGSYGEDA